MKWTYAAIRELLRDEPLPTGLVDLDAFDANLESFVQVARRNGKKLRLATKSVRVPSLIRRALDKGEGVVEGLMCYGAQEACWLARQGFSDLLVAYPIARLNEVRALHAAAQEGHAIGVMVDSVDGIAWLEGVWASLGTAPKLPLCLDVDMSFRRFGMHLGVRRSPLYSVEAARLTARRAKESRQVELVGLMGYEAQIAGVGEKNPFTPLRNGPVALMKRLSSVDVREKRRRLAAVLREEGIPLRYFNAGGTGSVESSSAEEVVTEVTIGSGLLQSHLFDYYAGVKREPALFFALPITRRPEMDIVTCHSGGFIASGTPGNDRLPRPYLPQEMLPFADEGFGEVQTPLRNRSGIALGLGDPVIFRPAKAGEIAERFNYYGLLQNGQLIGRTETYRGLGHCFY